MLERELLFKGTPKLIDDKNYVKSEVTGCCYDVDSIIEQINVVNSANVDDISLYGEYGNPTDPRKALDVKQPIIRIENLVYENGNIYGNVIKIPDAFPDILTWAYSMRSITDVSLEKGFEIHKVTKILAIDIVNSDHSQPNKDTVRDDMRS